MKIFKTKYEINNIIKIMAKHQEWIANLQTRITEIEKIVKNQPLIKKYQKTLDIFLKNAQD